MLLGDFLGFEGREEALRKIIRFNMERRTPMFYRTNDLIHSLRVHLLVKDIGSVLSETYGEEIDIDKTLTLALVHDDAEIITGDIQLYDKERMTPEQLAEVDANEERAIEELARRWPEKVREFFYRELLHHSLRKDCLEAQVVSYCDKVDGFCESLHEVFAGNPKFLGTARAYVTRIRDFPRKFPILNKLIPRRHPLLNMPVELEIDNILANGDFHGVESVDRQTGISHYDRWKQITVENFGYSPLIEVKER